MKTKCNLFFITTLILLVGFGNALSDDIYFKDGRILKNVKILHKEGSMLIVQTSTGESRFPKERILRIEEREFDPNVKSRLVTSESARTTKLDTLKNIKYGYMHIGIWGSLGIASSTDISNAIEPFEISNLNFGKNFNIIFGIRKILQTEFRKHTFAFPFFIQESEISGGSINIERLEISMKTKFNEWLFKFNPFFTSIKPPWALFFVYGIGKGEYVDEIGDGFKNGKEKIYGLELTYLLKFLSASVFLEWRKVNFENFTIAQFGAVDEDFLMNHFSLGIKMSVGFGK